MPIPNAKRILLKLSGEVLMGEQEFGIDPAFVSELAKEVKQAKDAGWEICLGLEKRPCFVFLSFFKQVLIRK